jgi:hypothetical protein
VADEGSDSSRICEMIRSAWMEVKKFIGLAEGA